jgi:hypothetical protein
MGCQIPLLTIRWLGMNAGRAAAILGFGTVVELDGPHE